MVADSVGDETRKEEEEAGFNSEELVDLSMQNNMGNRLAKVEKDDKEKL